MERRSGLVKPPGRWLLTVTSDDEDEAWVAEDLNGAGQGGAAPTLSATLDLLEAAERRLTLAKLAQPRLSPAFLTWDPNLGTKFTRMFNQDGQIHLDNSGNTLHSFLYYCSIEGRGIHIVLQTQCGF